MSTKNNYEKGGIKYDSVSEFEICEILALTILSLD